MIETSLSHRVFQVIFACFNEEKLHLAGAVVTGIV